jgi:transcription elongation factor Elf1
MICKFFVMALQRPVPAPLPPPSCPKCGSARMTITGKSKTPPMAYALCQACGHMTVVASR